MATSTLSSYLRRSRQSLSIPIFSQLINLNRHPLPRHPTLPPPPPPPLSPFDTCTSHFRTRFNSQAVLGAFHSRAFSTHSPDDDSEILLFDDEPGGESQVAPEPFTEIEQLTLDVTNGEDSTFPVRALISILDGFHDLTGLPWWMVIASSTLALRIALLPLLILQLHKLKRIVEFLPRLPPPFPPPLSGRSYKDQIFLFQKERKAVGCPSPFWFLAHLCFQVPCFLLWVGSIRKMSLEGHPGFDCGGALWFQDLTQLSHGWSGFIFPVLIAGLHLINVQISLRKNLPDKASDTFASLVKLYRWYLNLITVPISLACFALPQGSLLYWTTNSSLSLIQQLTLRHPAVLAKLGLQDNKGTEGSKMIPSDSLGSQYKSSPKVASEETSASQTASLDSPEKWFRIPAENLSPKELIDISVLVQSNGDKESAILLLKLALDKDPEHVRALVLLGHHLLQNQSNVEAIEYFERAILKLSLASHQAEVEDVDLLILASQWAGIACERQGKRAEGLVHFERVANMEEPEDPACKAHYFNGLLLLASTLYDAGQKDEAAKYLRRVAAYNPAYRKYLESCERDDDISSDLARSRREF